MWGRVSGAGDCIYATLTQTTSPYGDASGVTLVYPRFCAGAMGGVVVPLPVGSGDAFALGTEPPSALGALPVLLPRTDLGVSSEGFYYAAACVQTGL